MDFRTHHSPIPSFSSHGSDAGVHSAQQDIKTAIVNDLSDSGAGSLRNAIASNTIVTFSVAGLIELERELYYANLENFWIMGETAPNPGITIQHLGFSFSNCRNFHVSHVRVRCGSKYAGGYFDEWIKISGTKYKSQSFQWERLSNDFHVHSLLWNGITQKRATNSQLIDGKWHFDHGANYKNGEVYVDVGEDPKGGTLIIRLIKGLMPDPVTLHRCEKVLFRNCSFSHGTDIGVLADATSEMSVINSIYSDALDYPHHPKGPHSKHHLAKCDRNDPSKRKHLVARCLFIRTKDRCPRVASGNEMIIANNLGYDCAGFLQCDFRDLAIGYGKMSVWKNQHIATDLNWSNNEPQGAPLILCGPSYPSGFAQGKLAGEVYVGDDNLISARSHPDEPWRPTFSKDPWTDTMEADTTLSQRGVLESNVEGNNVPLCCRLSEPHDIPEGWIDMPATELLHWIVRFCGARPWNRDAIDEGIMDELNELAVRVGGPYQSDESQIPQDWRPDIPALQRSVVTTAGDAIKLCFSEAVEFG